MLQIIEINRWTKEKDVPDIIMKDLLSEADTYENAIKWYEENSMVYILHKNKIIKKISCGGEPEDQTLDRDWSWVIPMIEQAYELGKQDGLPCSD